MRFRRRPQHPDGKRVELSVERWAHTMHPDSHPEMAEYRGAPLRAIERPTERFPVNSRARCGACLGTPVLGLAAGCTWS